MLDLYELGSDGSWNPFDAPELPDGERLKAISVLQSHLLYESHEASYWLETEEDIRLWIKQLDETDGWLKTEDETSKTKKQGEMTS